MSAELASYDIVEKLHESSNSIIYRALDKTDRVPVILKQLQPLRSDSEALNLFQREYDMTRCFRSDGVVQAFRLERAHRTPVIVEEDIGARSLNIWLKIRALTPEECLPLAVRIADCVQQIHDAGILHKDLNPSNIIWNPEIDQVKIIDLGIASHLSMEAPAHPSTMEGTLPYMSPEQTGRVNRMLDYSSDLYSLGVTFYEMFTGRLPFETRDPMELVHCHIARQATPPHVVTPRVPEVISGIILKLMAKNSEERYQSASGLRHDLSHCLKQLRRTGQCETFPLGKRDVSRTLRVSQKLYGRERDVEALLAALERVRLGSAELFLVAGYAGIGKTALVREVHKSMAPEKGYFISGKFDRYSANIPYFAVASAFQSLIRHILAEPEDRVQIWREKLTAALGANGEVVVEVIPELEKIVGVQPHLENLGPIERKSRFKMAFRNFVDVVTDNERPLVLFLDDLQWIDSASLELLVDILTAQDIKHLLIIGAYRDNEVDSLHPLMQKVSRIKKKENSQVFELSLRPLSEKNLADLLRDTFNANPAEIEQLCHLLNEKTAGNPFFVTQFLKALYDAKSVQFDAEQGRWSWDLDKIVAENITDNVVELMVQRLQALPESLLETIRVASCIGHEFDLQTLSIVLQRPPEKLHGVLMQAARGGFVLPVHSSDMSVYDEVDRDWGNINFKFLHDRVQQAAYTLIGERRRKEVHYSIGRLRLETYSPGEISENIFLVVNHFNYCDSLLEEEERTYLAELNLAAALKAKESTAYQPALRYLVRAMEWLPPHSWRDKYELTFQIYKNRSEIEYLNNNFPVSEGLIRDALAKIASDVEKADFYNLQITLDTMSANYERAVEAGTRALELLGIQLTESDHQVELQNLVAEIEQETSERGISSLIDNEKMTDPRMIISIKIMANMLPLTFLSNPQLYQTVAAKSVLLSIRQGHAPESSICYSGYGILLVKMGSYRAGFDFGMLALGVSERFSNYSQRCKAGEVLVAHLNHWIHPMRQFREIADIAYQAADASGEIQFAGYTMKYAAGNLLFMGEGLISLQSELHKYLAYCLKTQNQVAVDVLHCYDIFIRELIGENGVETALIHENRSVEQHLKTCREHKSLMAICILHTLRCQSFYLFGHYREALNSALEAREILDSVPGSIVVAKLAFYHSLALAALMEQATEEIQKSYLEQLKSNRAQLEEWFGNCPDNFSHIYFLVSAELARVEGDDFQAIDLYDRAIAAAHNQGFVHHEALAGELGAAFWMGKGKEEIAELYLRKAYYCYKKWGAKRKVENLELKYPQYRLKSGLGPLRDTSSSNDLDLSAVIKASQAISREIDMPSLLSRIMGIIVENAGAQKGILILSQEGTLVIKAIALDRNDIEILPSDPTEKIEKLENSGKVPQSIIRYVFRSGDTTILHHDVENADFAGDEYIAQNQPKSILAMPLRYQDNISGVLYLENNLAANVFTEQRVVLLDLLLSQATISLENSRLFEEQKRVYRALEESGKKYHSLFASVNEGVALHDIVYDSQGQAVDYRILEVNPAYSMILGIPAHKASGAFASELYGAAEPPFLEIYLKVAETGQPDSFETWFPPMNMHFRVSVFSPRRGQFATLFTDITETKKSEAKIEASLKEKEVLLKEIHHRAKNNLQIILSLLRLQSENIEDRHYLQLFKESQNRIRAMALVHEKLYQSDDLADVDFREYITSLVGSLCRTYGIKTEKIETKIEVGKISLGLKNAIPFGLIINELVTNAFKHAFPGERTGEIRILFHSTEDGGLLLEIGDNGVGIPSDIDFSKKKSLGLYLVNILAEGQLHGKVALDRSEGTTFRIRVGGS